MQKRRDRLRLDGRRNLIAFVRKRAQHKDDILPLLRKALAARSALEWEAEFGDAVPCAAARSVEDMFDEPQVLAEDLLARIEHPTLGSYRGFTRPVKFGRTPGPEPFAAPTLGQHDDAIRASLGESGSSRSG